MQELSIMGEAVPLRPTDRAMPDPSPELWAEFCRLMNMGLRKPKDFDAEVRTTRAILEAHRQNATIMRTRSAEYDEATAHARELFANWFEAIVATIRMQQAGKL